MKLCLAGEWPFQGHVLSDTIVPTQSSVFWEAWTVNLSIPKCYKWPLQDNLPSAIVLTERALCPRRLKQVTCRVSFPMSLLNGHFKTIFSVHFFQLKELCFSGDLKNEYAESLPHCHQYVAIPRPHSNYNCTDLKSFVSSETWTMNVDSLFTSVTANLPAIVFETKPLPMVSFMLKGYVDQYCNIYLTLYLLRSKFQKKYAHQIGHICHIWQIFDVHIWRMYVIYVPHVKHVH